jgi:hypothetical protein
MRLMAFFASFLRELPLNRSKTLRCNLFVNFFYSKPIFFKQDLARGYTVVKNCMYANIGLYIFCVWYYPDLKHLDLIFKLG